MVSVSFMKSIQLHTWLPWLSLLLLALVAGAPLLSMTQVPNGYDTAFHFWRAVQAEQLLRHGVRVPRWAPDMAWGYGYPLFIFQGALSAQLAAGLHLMGMAWPGALNGAYFIGVAGSMLSLFLFARALWGHSGGWKAAACFPFIPYHVYVVYYRGSLSETVALIFPPLVLWGITRWCAGARRGLLVGTLALAALALTHSMSLYIFMPFFGLWALAEVWGAGAGQRWPALGRVLVLFSLGLGLGMFAWLPGLAERSFVQLERATSAWVFDYRENFLPWHQLLSLPRRADPHLVNDWPARGLGAFFVLAALGALIRPGQMLGKALKSGSPQGVGRPQGAQLASDVQLRQRSRLIALELTFVICTVLSLRVSQPLWDGGPFGNGVLAAFQFPWRFLAPASLAMAVLIGASFSNGPPFLNGASSSKCTSVAPLATRMALYPLFAVGVLIAAHWGWLYPQMGPLPTPASSAGLIAWEQATHTLGTTASRELLPRWVEQMPAADNPVTGALLDAARPARLDVTTLPAGAQVVSATYRLTSAVLHIDTPRAFQARYRVFYYPGWRVLVDHVPVVGVPETETGWLTFPVPAGEHRVEVHFSETPLRWLADVVSWFSLGALGLLVGRGRVSGVIRHTAPLAPYAARSMLVIALALCLLKFAVADKIPVLWRESRLRADGTLAGVGVPLRENFDGRALLLGVDPPPAKLTSTADSLLTLYWRALNPEGREWRVGLTLVGPDASRMPVGVRPYRWGREPPPMSMWSLDAYARLDLHMDIVPGMPPGNYELWLALFDRGTLEPASVLDAVGNPVGPALNLGKVTLLPPQSPPTLAALSVPADAELQACGALGLWDMALDRAQAAPGDVLALRWVWEALAASPDTVEAVLTLYTAEGADVRQWSLPLAAAWWPTDQWQAGERWLGTPQVRLPGSLKSGLYRVAVQLPQCTSLLAEATLTVTAPDRAWTMPVGFSPTGVGTTAAAVFAATLPSGDVIALLGYTLPTTEVAPGETLSLQLAWQALAEMETAYHVFVHIVDANGMLLAQSDGEPVAWTRPTPGWAVGEVVVDARDIVIPQDAAPGVYEIRVGWYVPGVGRLSTADRDFVLLAEWRIGE